MHALHEILIERPPLIKVVSKIDANSPEIAYSYDILFTFSHVFHMRQRKVLNDNEWIGWLRWVKSAFQLGAIMEIWQSTIEMEKWFDSAYQEFVNRELVPRVPENKKIGSIHRLPLRTLCFFTSIPPTIKIKVLSRTAEKILDTAEGDM
jgi:hypothetical protein